MSVLNKMEPLPSKLKKYFWDCDFDSLNMEEYSGFITERILNFGNSDSIRWLLAHTDELSLKEIIENSRNLNEKTRNYWKTIL